MGWAAVVATAHPLATVAGLRMFEAGGNASDVGVAAVYAAAGFPGVVADGEAYVRSAVVPSRMALTAGRSTLCSRQSA